MNIPHFEFDEWRTQIAGALGAIVSLTLIKGPWPTRVVLAICGAVVSFYAGGTISQKFGIPESLAGFMTGLFGMAILSRVWDWIQAAPVGLLWQALLDRVRGTPTPPPPPGGTP